MTIQTNEANPPIVIKPDSHCVVTTASSHLHFAFDNQLAKLSTVLEIAVQNVVLKCTKLLSFLALLFKSGCMRSKHWTTVTTQL